MANGNGNGMRQHQDMARGGSPKSGGNFGCESFSSMNDGGHNMGSSETGTLGDGQRAGPPHISRGGGQMGATAHSDHGPHNLPGGVASLKSVQG